MFHPPSCETMSEEVIGTVLLRKQPQRHFSSVTTAARQRKNSMSSILTGPNVSIAKRLLTMDELRTITDQETLAKLGLLLKDRRERRKIIQQRHQKKKARMAEELIDYVPKLREEVEKLKFRHNSLKTRMTKNSIWSVASEYFRVFQHGFPRLETSQAEAIVFLRATMTSDVNIGIVSGIDALVERWKVFARTFPDGAVQLERLNRISDASLVATTSTRVLLTREAIESIFPRLRENSTRRDVILKKLLGQSVVLRGSVRFHWDSATKRVAELVTCMEMMSPMLQLLGNLEDVAFACHGASDLMM